MKTTLPALLATLPIAACLLALPTGAAAAEAEADPDTGAVVAESLSPVGLDGVELDELEADYEPEVKRFIVPPYYQEERGPVTFKTVLPLFFYRERTGEGARTDLGVLPFYWRYREGPERADVYFPLYWSFQGPSFETDIVLQTYWNRSDHGHNFGFAPLVFFGKNTDEESSHQVVPPLFWRFTEKDESFLLAGLYYDSTDGDDFDLGLPPIFFAGRERDKSYLVVLPPLFWRFADDVRYKTTTVLPPVFYRTREHGWSLGLVPLLYLARDEKWARTLVTPFYYGSRWGKGRSHYIPPLLSYYRHAPKLSQGGIAAFYHWFDEEGDFLRMYSPLVWWWGNRHTNDRSWMIPPLFYRHDSPVANDTMVGLLYWNFHEHHRERTFALMPLFGHNWSLYERRWRTWIFPTLDFGVKPGGYHARLHPLFYRGKDRRSSHLVLAPIVWRFLDEEDRNTVLFPLWWNFRDIEHDQLSRVAFPLWWQFDDYRRDKSKKVFFPIFWDFKNGKDGERSTVVVPLVWRDRDPESTMTGVLNFVWHKGEIKQNPFWSFQIFPLIGMGKPPVPEGQGSYWSFLGGFAGWRRQGSTKELKILWIPFDVSDDDEE